MSTVLSALRLLALIMGGCVYFAGLGCWLLAFLFREHSVLSQARQKVFPVVALALVTGMVVNYALVLIIQTLSVALMVGGILAVGGLVVFFGTQWRSQHLAHLLDWSELKWLPVVLLACVLYLSAMLSLPLQDWDARSIWFFHAKMIYSANSIGFQAGWTHASTDLTHVDYPNLVPVIAAQIGAVSGFWNEYLPKLALFFVLLPALLWLFSFARKAFSFAFLVCVIPLYFSGWMWNGYMDAYLAVYLGFVLLLLLRFYQQRTVLDAYGALVLLCVLPDLKNEGYLGVVAVAVPAAVWLLAGVIRKRFSLAAFKPYLKDVLIFLPLLLPIVLWTVYQRLWGVQNDLHIASTQAVSKIVERVLDGSLFTIINTSKYYFDFPITLALLTFVTLAIRKRYAWKEFWPFGLAALVYYLGLVTIYLLTPYDLNWHLRTSIERTMLCVDMCLWVGTYALLTQFEPAQEGAVSVSK